MKIHFTIYEMQVEQCLKGNCSIKMLILEKKKEFKSIILNFHFKRLEKNEYMKPKASRRQ